SDSAPRATLTNLGQQEVQIYTGGTPASAEASGLSGYVNQVIRTGTYPGFRELNVGLGGPALYNSASLEIGSATPDRRFSYYVGTSLVGQGFRYGDQYNGVGNPLFFYPLAIPSNDGTVYDGSGPAVFAPGASYAIASTTDHESIANFHLGIPHGSAGIKDDVQLLYMSSDILQRFYSSINDLGGPAYVYNAANGGSYLPFFDQYAYNGPLYAAPNPSDGSVALFPNSPQNRAGFTDPLPANLREGSDNGVTLLKLQYQRNIDAKSYIRLLGYTDYSNWFISGPVSAQLIYGAQLPDYEVIGHTYGGDLIYSRQLSEKHLVNLTTSYQTSKLQTYSMGFGSGPVTNWIDAGGVCYSPNTGFQTSCFNNSDTSGMPTEGTIAGITAGQATGLTPAITAPPGTPGLTNNAQWVVTENGQNAQVDNVAPYFSAISLNDQWRPNEKLTVSLGLRVDDFRYRLQDLSSGYPARAFWFAAYNRENCFGPGLVDPVQRSYDAAGNLSQCPTGTTPVQLKNYTGGTTGYTVVQPRLGFTYQLSADNVIRASYGRYARPAPTSYQQYNTFQQDLPSFIATFLNLGYTSPVHDVRPDTSNNYDLSLEHHFKGTDMAFKLTPFYRNTQNQIQYLALNAQGVVAGENVGRQRSYGVEFAFSRGDFAKDGLSFQASLTYTRSRIRYGNFHNGSNIIDLLNTYVKQYNSYTSACASANPNPAVCGLAGAANAQPVFSNNGVPVANPYYGQPPQSLFDRSGEYTTYDLIPAPFNAALGFETPIQTSLILNYKRGKFNVSPSATYSSGSVYGSPLVWPGYDPSSCTATVGATAAADPTTCSSFLFIPDKYTGRFDNLGAFREPTRLTTNVSLGYEISDRVKTNLTLTGLVDHCYQRGQPWDSPTTCIYGQLASNLLAPAGNFAANPPPQLAYPYGSWYNNVEVGQIGQKSPLTAILSVNFKL
ncbi:MAG: TonB-dependent receptor, partial [Candidatus Eremiobacteraeota bacterium]|nr:TonB-dependent receptor [Candidatus Eremiobacteraeota bacterium]